MEGKLTGVPGSRSIRSRLHNCSKKGVMSSDSAVMPAPTQPPGPSSLFTHLDLLRESFNSALQNASWNSPQLGPRPASRSRSYQVFVAFLPTLPRDVAINVFVLLFGISVVIFGSSPLREMHASNSAVAALTSTHMPRRSEEVLSYSAPPEEK